jgi:hypothetical protein
MGKIKGPYEPEYPEGTFVVIADRATLERFLTEWPKVKVDSADYTQRRNS